MSDADEVRQQLMALRLGYARRLPDKLDGLAILWPNLAQLPDPASLTKLHLGFHSLAGTSATYGYSDFSQAARQMEYFIKSLLEVTAPDPAYGQNFARLLQNLHEQSAAILDQSDRGSDWQY